MCRGLRIVKIDMKKSNQFKYQFKNAMDCGWLFNKLRKLFTKKRALQQNHVNLLNFFRNKVLQDYEKHHFSTSGRTAYISFSWAENIGAYQIKPEILKMHGFFQYALAGPSQFQCRNREIPYILCFGEITISYIFIALQEFNDQLR